MYNIKTHPKNTTQIFNKIVNYPIICNFEFIEIIFFSNFEDWKILLILYNLIIYFRNLCHVKFNEKKNTTKRITISAECDNVLSLRSTLYGINDNKSTRGYSIRIILPPPPPRRESGYKIGSMVRSSQPIKLALCTRC